MGKYYWLKLKRDFLNRHDMKILRKMPNGNTKFTIYLALLLESVDHEGRLRFSEDVPYTPELLAAVVEESVEDTDSTIDTLIQLGLMDMEPDGTYIMTKVQNMIESASDTSAAKRMRELREQRKKEENEQERTKCSDVRTECSNKRTNRSESIENRDKRIEIKEKEQEEKEKTPYSQIVAEYTAILGDKLPKVLKLTDARKAAIRARWEEYGDAEAFTRLFKKTAASAFLTGQNDRKWTADFDWLMKPTNFTKVLEGKYDDRKAEKEKEKGSFNTADFFKAAVNRRA